MAEKAKNKRHKKITLPPWLLEEKTRLPEEEKNKDGVNFFAREVKKFFPFLRSGVALERTLKAVLSFVEYTLFNEKTASRDGLLQKVEPRTKLLVLVSLLAGLSLERTLQGMSRFIVLGAALAVLSRIPAGMYLKRLLPGVLFTAVIALPASLGAVTPGEPVFHIATFKGSVWLLGHSIYISRQGCLAALGLVARVAGSLMIILLAGFTTRPQELVKTVSFFIPGFLKTVFSMSYRYMFFLVRRLEEFILARKARGAGHLEKDGAGEAGAGRKWVGSRAASLLIISLELKRELKFAMEARGAPDGSTGNELREAGLPAFRFGWHDAVFVLLAASVAVI